ncbi:phosphohydrolase [Cryobacterium zongtaii]|uniref:Phosphohydrolase n=1 Tax=Cryobacterium zongtaii TaxID=1259217 RepID=A0A2S3ZHN3_9MICO|nr:phosphohydrolase [Cryobacterium zongtaii]POH66933.1 phosphohydrolase [Cryobacterium zongtaii]
MAERPAPFWRRLTNSAGLREPDRGELATNAIPFSPPTARVPRPAADAEPAGATPDAVDSEVLLAVWFAREQDDMLVWRTCLPGASTAEIATRLSLVPASFLADDVAILPLAENILEMEYGAVGSTPPDRRGQEVLRIVDQVRATGSAAARRGAALVLWLWASEDLNGPLSVPLSPVWYGRAMAALSFRLAAVVDPAEWVRTADRRDEAARTFLLWSGHLPAGEDEATARSILAMRDSLQQNAALAQTMAEHEHRLQVTKQLQEARAREAAARYSNE